jgi:uncharacterized membrane protein YgcG
MRIFGRRRKLGDRLPTYSNESVIAAIERDAGVDRDTARAWFAEMLIFLDLVAESREFISPPKLVDAAWHAFILHTRDYEAYCRERFGRVIHHEPTDAADPEAYRRAYDRRTRLGSFDNAVWAAPVGGAAAIEARDSAGDAGAGPGGDGGGGFGGWDWGGGSDGGGGGGCGGGGGG